MKYLYYALCLVVASVTTAWAEPQTLKFNPPDSVGYTVKTISVRQQWVDTTRRMVDSTFETVKSKLHKIPGGYELSSVITHYGGNRNNIPFDSSLVRVMEGFKTTVLIDTNGEATTISGYEGLFNRVDSLIDKTTAEPLKSFLSPRLMSDRELNDWNDRQVNLVGRKLALKAIVADINPLVLPDDASLQLHEVSFIKDTVRTSGKLYATVHILADTDPKRLADSLHQTVDFIKEFFHLSDTDITQYARSVSRYQSMSDIVVDVSTLLVQREQISRRIVLKQVDLPEQKVITRVAETTDRKYVYSK